MARLGAAIVLAIALIAAFLLWNRDPGLPSNPSANGSQKPSATQPATGDTVTPADASANGRVEAPIDENSAQYIVRGVVLTDPRMPGLRNLRVVAYRGAAHDTSGLLSGSMAGNQRRSRPPAFILSGKPVAECLVGEDGRFELRASERHLRVDIDHDYYLLPAPEIVHISSEKKMTDLVLSPLLGGMVRGRLLGERAADVERVKLTLEINPMSFLRDMRSVMASMLMGERPEAVPSGDRTFVFRAVPPDAGLNFSVTGGRASARASFAGLQAGEFRDVIVSVGTAAMLSVEVVDDAGNAIPNASVSARAADKDGMAAVMESKWQSTMKNGFALFESIEAGTYHIEAMASGRTSDSITVDVAVEHEARQIKLVLGEGGVVTGIVKDPNGKPVAGARVAHHAIANIPIIGDLTEQLGPDYLSQMARSGAKTDEKGHFRLTGIADENAFLVVGAHEGFSAGVAREVHMGDVDVVVTLQPLSSVTGKIVAADSKEPIQQFNATIFRTAFLIMKMPISQQIVEDEAGAFRFEGISADSYTLQIEADGYGTITKSIKVPQDGSLEVGTLELQRAARILGVVRDDNQKPVPNAMVRIRKGAMADNPVLTMLMGTSSRTYSDQHGNFTLEPITPGRVQLLASAKGFATGTSERLEVEAGQQVDGILIEVGHGGSIRGKLTLGPNQQVEDFLVLAQHQVSQDSVPVDPAPDGSFLVENLDPGSYQLQAMPGSLLNRMSGMDVKPGQGMQIGEIIRQMTDGVVSQRCRVRSGEVAEAELDVRDLTIGAQWRVRVEIGGKPQAVGLVEVVALDSGTLRIGMIDNGVAMIGRMRPGRHRLQVRSGLAMTPVGGPQDLEYPANVEEHTSVLSLPGGELRGRVVDADTNEPLRSAIVRIHHDGHAERDDPIGMCLSNDEGQFAFTGLADGVYSLSAAEPFGTNGRNKASRQSGIKVESGVVQDRIELRSQPAAGASVQVTSHDGRAIPGATVLCVDAAGRPLGGLGIAATGRDGRAWFGGMADGQARVVGRAHGYAPSASILQPLASEQTTAFELVLSGGAPTRLSVVDAQGKRLRGVSLTAQFGDSPWLPSLLLVQTMEADGTFDLGRLGPGNWKFRATHPSIGTITMQRSITGGSPITIVMSQ